MKALLKALSNTPPPPLTALAGSMTVGILAWGLMWQHAASAWALPESWAGAVRIGSVLVWLLVWLAYAWVWRRESSALAAQFRHPVQSAFFSLLPVSALLAAISLLPVWPAAARTFVVVGLAGQLATGLWLVGRFWKGGRPMETITASAYLPAVASNLVAALAAASFGWRTVAELLFGAGIFSWLAMESLVMARAATHAELTADLRPGQGIQVAPPVVAGVAYLAIHPQASDLLSHMLFGYGLYQTMVALRLVHWSTRAGAVTGYWSYSFGVMALGSMSLQFMQCAPHDQFWIVVAAIAFGFANLVLVVLLLLTLHLFRVGRLSASPTVAASPTLAVAASPSTHNLA